MEQNYTLKQITDALGISRARVEQWIARGFFRAPNNPIVGAAREWQIDDAIRLAVCTELVDFGMSPEKAGKLVGVWVGLHGFKNDIAYLVVSSGMLGEIIPATPRGAPAPKKGAGKKVYDPDRLYDDIIKGSDLAKTLADPDRYVSIIINIDSIEKRIKGALGYKG